MISYHVLVGDALDDVYARVSDEGLMWALYPEVEDLTVGQWRELMAGATLALGGIVDDEMAGVLTVRPFMGRTQCAEVGVTAFRRFFRQAAPLARGAFLWAFEHLDCVSLVGRVAVPNRHILRMAPSVGFREMCRIPGMCWYTRKQAFVEGALLLATPETVKAACATSGSEYRTGRAAERHGEEE